MTPNEAIARARLTYPDCEESQAFDYLKEVLRDVLQDVKGQRQSVQIDVAPGESAYDLPSGTLSVWTAAYVAGVGDGWSLRATSEEELDDVEPLWRDQVSLGEPRVFFVSGPKIWIYPPAQAPTQGGFPRLVLSATIAPVIGPTTELPTVLDGMVYIEGIRARHSRDQRLESAALHEQAYQREKERATLAERRQQPPGPQGWRPGWIDGQRRVI